MGSLSLLLFWLAACPSTRETPAASESTPVAVHSDSPHPDSPKDTQPPWPALWSDRPCDGISTASSGYQTNVDRWLAQMALLPPPTGQIVAVGSSSMRRWERAFSELSPFGVIQRGIGGAKLWEIAGFAEELVVATKPGAVLVYAGTNDIADGIASDTVVTSFRCLCDRTWEHLGKVPLYFIGIVPAPSRWSQWEAANAVNTTIASLASQHPGIVYIDTPSAFLQTGSPPDASLFVEDQLHLSTSGYQLWTSTILPVLQANQTTRPIPVPAAHPPAQTRVRVDFGPSNAEDGTKTGTDSFGLVWNSWHDVSGDEQILPGETLGLVDTSGQPTGFSLVITGGFLCNGLQNGGLISPDPAFLGDLAVGTATQDFFYTDGPDNPGGISITGLDPAHRYTLTLFGSRDWGDETRITRYRVEGSQSQSISLTTSGPGIGSSGGSANDNHLATLTGLAPDMWGQLWIDIEIEAGTYAYLSLLELTVE